MPRDRLSLSLRKKGRLGATAHVAPSTPWCPSRRCCRTVTWHRPNPTSRRCAATATTRQGGFPRRRPLASKGGIVHVAPLPLAHGRPTLGTHLGRGHSKPGQTRGLLVEVAR